MLLNEIAYLILEEARQARIIDDESIDLRLMKELIRLKRVDYLVSLINTRKDIPQNCIQETLTPLSVSSYAGTMVLRSTLNIATPVNSNLGVAIIEIASMDFEQYPFSIVNNSHFRVVGNGRFNGGYMYVTYRNKFLYFKTKDVTFNSMDNCILRLIAEVPEEVEGFDVDTMDYPLDFFGINFIKDKILGIDMKTILSTPTDVVNDSSGVIK